MVSSQKRLYMALILVNLAFIWGNSLLPAQTSAAFSSWVKSVLLFFLPDGESAAIQGHGLLRKAAHFLEFACYGALWCRYLLMGQRKPVLGYLPGICTACIDETIQCFVPGRGPRVTDIMIDLGGFSLGLAVILLIQKSISKWRTKS